MPAPNIDWALAALADAAAANKSQLRLSLFLGGLVVSGTAVGDEVFFQRIGLAGAVETIALRQEEDYTERAEINEKLGRDDITPDEREELRARARGLEREFISMVDVTILGAGPVALKVPAWRGRLSQVSGWVLGSLDEPE